MSFPAPEFWYSCWSLDKNTSLIIYSNNFVFDPTFCFDQHIKEITNVTFFRFIHSCQDWWWDDNQQDWMCVMFSWLICCVDRTKSLWMLLNAAGRVNKCNRITPVIIDLIETLTSVTQVTGSSSFFLSVSLKLRGVRPVLAWSIWANHGDAV